MNNANREIYVCRADTGSQYLLFERKSRDASPVFDRAAMSLRVLIGAAYQKAFAAEPIADLTLTHRRLSEVLDNPDGTAGWAATVYMPEGFPTAPDRWCTAFYDTRLDVWSVGGGRFMRGALRGQLPPPMSADFDRPGFLVPEQQWRQSWRAIEFVPEVRQAFEEITDREARHRAWVEANRDNEERLEALAADRRRAERAAKRRASERGQTS